MPYCDDPIGEGWNDTLRAYFCGIREAFTGPASGVATGAQESIVTVATGAQDTIGGIADNAAGVATGAQDTIAALGQDAKDAANPLNLLGLGAGLGFGTLLTAVGVGLVGAFAADQVFAGGVGTQVLVARVRGRVRR